MTQPKYAKGDLVTIELETIDAEMLTKDLPILLRPERSISHTRPEPKTKDVWLTWIKLQDGDTAFAFDTEEEAERFSRRRDNIITRAFKVTIPRDETCSQ